MATSSPPGPRKPTYAPLFSNLAGSDAAAIVEQLDADGVQYELDRRRQHDPGAQGPGLLAAPEDERRRACRPTRRGGGYSILDNQNVMTSEFMQQVGYRRALEGELAKTIKSIDGVTAATVHLAIPQKDVFTDDQQKPTASVLVATGAGKDLDGRPGAGRRPPGVLERRGPRTRPRHRRRRRRPGPVRQRHQRRRRRRRRPVPRHDRTTSRA